MMLLRAFLAFSVSLSLAAKVPSFHSEAIGPELDPEDSDTMAQFDKDFNKPKITDPEEEAKHEKALNEDEASVKAENGEFEAGNKTWEDAVNKFADMPEDEYKKELEGADPNPEKGFKDTLMPTDIFTRGALAPTKEEIDRAESKFGSYFAGVRASFDRSQYPSHFSSVDRGWVTPVKSQGTCASCVAFASMATIETCFKRVTGDDGDYSEQQMVDCAWGKNGANGCDPSQYDAYLKYAEANSNSGIAAEVSYPYKDAAQRCSNAPAYKRGAKMTGYRATFSGNEDILMSLVAQRGSALVGIDSSKWSAYSGGVFAGGPTNTPANHAVTVVGWGSDRREGDYWLIKNSWGADWGEAGYIRLQRGTGMCGIGRIILVTDCEAVAGPTSAPLAAPAQPCMDKEHGKECMKYAKLGYCGVTNQAWIVTYMKMCSKSCGKCPGEKAPPTSSCVDEFSNCNLLTKSYCGAKTGSWPAFVAKCPRSCGKCPGMTPVASNYCWDEWSSCPRYRNYCSNTQVATACKKTCRSCQ